MARDTAVLGRRRIRMRSARDRNAGGAWLASDVPVKTDAKQAFA